MAKNADKILQKIKKDKVMPRAKWIFLLQNYLIWSFFILAILLGAIAVSVILFLLIDNDWEIRHYLRRSFISHFFLTLPYLWFFVLSIFSILAYFNYKQTKDGYKINSSLLISSSILASILLGIILFSFDFGHQTDRMFSHYAPRYNKIIRHKEDIWCQPQRGLLAGEILQAQNKYNFIIKDFKNNQWRIDGRKAIWRRRVDFKKGEFIKIIGVDNGDYIFTANEIRTWRGRAKHGGYQK